MSPLKKPTNIFTDMPVLTDMTYRPIHIGSGAYRYRYIGFADIAHIGRYSVSADTDMPTLPQMQESLNNLIILKDTAFAFSICSNSSSNVPEVSKARRLSESMVSARSQNF